jgi:outer membrane cobalamin receptor
MRQAEVLETVPGVIITQHSGEGKPTSISCAGSISITAATSP